jgi:sterol desaturase/sphingolipid hydroxylase (fatty acid hydroxylase superfamily)
LTLLEDSVGLIPSAPKCEMPPPEVRAESDIPSVNESRVRAIMAGGFVLLALGILALKLLYPFAFLSHQPPGSLLHWLLPRVRKVVGSWSLASMLIYPFGVFAIFTMEQLFPAVPTQKTLSTGLVHDGIWELATAVVGVVLAKWWGAALYVTYTRHFSFLTLPLAPRLPPVARLVIGAVVIDFLKWFQHWLNHRVPRLWSFHAIHHSQKEINMFSPSRIHIVEVLINYALGTIPMLMLGLKSPEVTWWILIIAWKDKFYHANIRTDFGPLRYLFVSPQSHRIHHSNQPEHFDQNYGSLLTVWDYLFRTQYRRYDVYPDTGVDDQEFPVETSRSVATVLTNPVRQTLYPFRKLWNGVKRAPVGAGGKVPSPSRMR